MSSQLHFPDPHRLAIPGRFACKGLGTAARAIIAGSMLQSCFLAGMAFADPVSTEISLYARQFGATVLSAQSNGYSFSFQVDSATALEFVAGYVWTTNTSSHWLQTSITGPTGQHLDPDSVTSFGGDFRGLPGSTNDQGSLLMGVTGFGKGNFYIYTLPSLGPGEYTLNVSDPTLQSGESNLVTAQLSLKSPLVAAIIPSDPVAINTKYQTVSVAVFEGGQPVQGATVSLRIVKPDGSTLQMSCFDDGLTNLDGDASAGDGLYCSLLSPEQIAQAGIYSLAARISQMSTNPPFGERFVRDVGYELEVVAQAAILEPHAINIQKVSDGPNPCPTALAISVPVFVLNSNTGRYQLEAVLETASGQSLLAMGRETFGPAGGTITALIDAAALRDAGEDGPYEVTELRLQYLDGDGVQPADYAYNLTASTPEFTVAEFGCLPLQLNRIVGDVGVDENGDMAFDHLDVSLAMIAPAPGFYKYTAALVVPPCGQRIFVSGQKEFVATTNEQELILSFPGAELGQSGLDGPYQIAELTVAGPTDSLIRSDVGQTSAYSAAEFTSYQPIPDCTNLDCPSNLVVEATSPSGAIADLPACATTPCGAVVPVKYDPPSGSFLPFGVTEVICTALMPVGTSNQCRFTVTVADTTPPSLDCPSNLVVQSSSPGGTLVELSLLATDDADTNVTVTCDPPSGSTFPLGTTSVACSAADHSGNVAQCSFSVIVNGPPRIIAVWLVGRSLQFTFQAYAGILYVVEFKNNLSDPEWTTLRTLTGSGTPQTVADEVGSSIASRFYRVRRTDQ